MYAGNYRRLDSEINDYYATDPMAVELLLQEEKFTHNVWEPAVGGGNIAAVLSKHGYNVKCSDIIDRGYPNTEIINFLDLYYDERTKEYQYGDIITNPPYKYAKEFVETALNISDDGTKIAMLLKLTFLEGKARKNVFLRHPPIRIFVFSSRISCGKNGIFNKKDNAVAYAWFVWEKGYKGDPAIKWIN